MSDCSNKTQNINLKILNIYLVPQINYRFMLIFFLGIYWEFNLHDLHETFPKYFLFRKFHKLGWFLTFIVVQLDLTFSLKSQVYIQKSFFLNLKIDRFRWTIKNYKKYDLIPPQKVLSF